MKARNLARPRFRSLTQPRSVFDPPLATPFPIKVHICDYLSDSDLNRLSPHLAAIRKLGTLETDRDGLLSLAQAGVQISVSPELLRRAIRACDAVLVVALQLGWPVAAPDGGALRIMVARGSFALGVTEKTEPVIGIRVRPEERCPRRPTGALVVSLTAGDWKAMVCDKRGAQVESKLADLLAKAEVLGREVGSAQDRNTAIRREQDLECRRRLEMESRIDRLNRDVVAWQRARRIRAYVKCVADRLAGQRPISPESDGAKWLEWARRYADSVDPTRRPATMSPNLAGPETDEVAE
jgi:hypothetical protein